MASMSACLLQRFSGFCCSLLGVMVNPALSTSVASAGSVFILLFFMYTMAQYYEMLASGAGVLSSSVAAAIFWKDINRMKLTRLYDLLKTFFSYTDKNIVGPFSTLEGRQLFCTVLKRPVVGAINFRSPITLLLQLWLCCWAPAWQEFGSSPLSARVFLHKERNMFPLTLSLQ